MSMIVVVIFVIFFVIGIAFLAKKKNIVAKLNEMIQNREYDAVISFANDKQNRWYLTTYVRDLYTAKAYALKNDMDALKKHLQLMFQTQYSKNDTNQYLTLYCHYFIQKRDKEFAEEILEVIKKTEDRLFYQYCRWAKEVLIDGRNDLIEEMQESIEHKEYHSFPIGVVVYLIGLQKLHLEEYEEALEYFETALDVILPTDIYAADIQKEIDDLIE